MWRRRPRIVRHFRLFGVAFASRCRNNNRSKLAPAAWLMERGSVCERITSTPPLSARASVGIHPWRGGAGAALTGSRSPVRPQRIKSRQPLTLLTRHNGFLSCCFYLSLICPDTLSSCLWALVCFSEALERRHLSSLSVVRSITMCACRVSHAALPLWWGIPRLQTSSSGRKRKNCTGRAPVTGASLFRKQRSAAGK